MRRHFGMVFGLFLLLTVSGCTRSASKEATVLQPTRTQVTIPAAKTQPPPTVTLTSAPTSTATAEAIQPAPVPAGVYAVAFLGEGDALNLRTAPGLSADVILTLEPFARDLLATGGIEEAAGQTWIQIKVNDEITGWVSRQFVTEQVDAAAFCSDQRVEALLTDLDLALENKDGKRLSQLISPLHGLTIWHNWWNPAINFDSPEVVENIFFSTVDYDWGTEDGSGLPILGSFQEKVLPKLLDVFQAEYTRHCNVLETGISAGGTAGMLKVPAEYTNFNYFALFRLPPSAEEELNWRTWVAVIEYVDGVPYLAALVQYYWEI